MILFLPCSKAAANIRFNPNRAGAFARRSIMSTAARRNRSFPSSASYESFFKNTFRCWIFNENEQLRQRYVAFDPAELQLVAANPMGRYRCSYIEKIAEIDFNKIFLVRSDDGRAAIARIPTPIAGTPRYTTTSEVATLDFLRNTLGLPVPRVSAYSASSANPVRAEYIIMVRVHGESLASRWLSLTIEDVKDIMTQIVDIERKIISFRFPGYGSLYHKHDIEGEPRFDIPGGDFCIGPVVRRQFWHDARQKMKLDRGPCLSAEDCLTSAARRENACLSDHAKPRPRNTFLLPTDHNIDPSEHASLLTEFLRLAPLLVLTEHMLHAPMPRHPDLSLANILLAPGSTTIAGVIDWQNAAALPLFMQAGYPAFCGHDWTQPQSLKIPTPPEAFDHMDAEERLKAQAKFRLEEANLYYTAANGIQNKDHLTALRIPHLGMRQYLTQQTGYPWDADVINLRAALVGITTPDIWKNISPFPYPISFSEDERERALSESREWNGSEALLSKIRDDLRIDLEGGTEPDNFGWASRRNLEFRTEFWRQSEDHEREVCWRNWPYKDDEDASPLPTRMIPNHPLTY